MLACCAVGVALLAMPPGAADRALANGDTPTAVIARLVDAGSHPDLRWPRFPDYREALREVYATEEFAPLWFGDGHPTAQAQAMIAALAKADAEGLNAADYDVPWLAAQAEQLAAAGTPAAEQVGRFDVALTVAAMRFLSDAAVGRIDPRRLGYVLDTEAKRPNVAAEVRALAVDADPAQRLAALASPLPVHVRLKEALAASRAVAARTDLPPLPRLPKLRPGDHDAGLPALRAWLTAYGDMQEGEKAPPDPTAYDPTLAQAVRHFQRRHGLEPDAVIGRATQRALGVSPAQRVRQVELALERLRWLPYPLPDRFLLVNIPEFRLRGFEDSQPVPRLEMGVVVGSSAERTETPVLQADMRYLIFRPYWLVPSSIAEKELLPKAETDPSFLERQHMDLVNGRLRQRPGPSNSLGLLKFIFPNPHHVYFHDTPSKSLFRRSRRDFSHGCVRVADPRALAEFVLDGQPGWDSQRIDAAMKRGPNNRRVDLQKPVPVYLIYTTVAVEPDGQVDFFDDIYGEDASLDALLKKGHPYRQ